MPDLLHLIVYELAAYWPAYALGAVLGTMVLGIVRSGSEG